MEDPTDNQSFENVDSENYWYSKWQQPGLVDKANGSSREVPVLTPQVADIFAFYKCQMDKVR